MSKKGLAHKRDETSEKSILLHYDRNYQTNKGF